MTKTAVITGGAGAIAVELAGHLLREGYRLVLVGRDRAKLEAAAALLRGEVELLLADLTVMADLQRVGAEIEALADLELLVNNAGVIQPGNVVETSVQNLQLHIGTNLLAPMLLSQAAARNLVKRRTGCILSIASAASLVALPGSAAYSASKFGLRGFLIALSQELAPHGVQVRGVFPGAVDTPMLRYEATHGGSVLNFLNKDVLSVGQVAQACLAAMRGSSLETYLPFWDGVTSRLVCVMPGLMPSLLPHFERSGRRGLERFLLSRGLAPGASPGSRSADK